MKTSYILGVVLFWALFDELFVRIIHLTPLHFGDLNLSVSLLFRSVVAISQWLFVLSYFDNKLPTQWLVIVSSIFAFVLVGHAAVLFFVENGLHSSFISTEYFSLLHRAVKVFSSGIITLVLFFKVKYGNLNQLDENNGVKTMDLGNLIARNYVINSILLILGWVIAYFSFRFSSLYFLFCLLSYFHFYRKGSIWISIFWVLIITFSLLLFTSYYLVYDV